MHMKKSQENLLERLKNMISRSDNIVCITGLGTVVESGGVDIWSVDNLYRIEKEYGDSPEELLSAGIYATKKEKYFKFYKNEVIHKLPVPSETFTALKKLQDMGKLKTTISMNIYGLEYRSGLRNVIEFQGTVYSNYCPMCKKNFPLDYIVNAPGVPACDCCKVALRPGLRLFGESVRNDRMTDAALACANADLVLVLGTNLYGSKVRYATGHYGGNKLILINEEEHFTDRYADYVIHGKCKDILPLLVEDDVEE